LRTCTGDARAGYPQSATLETSHYLVNMIGWTHPVLYWVPDGHGSYSGLSLTDHNLCVEQYAVKESRPHSSSFRTLRASREVRSLT